LPVIFNCGTGTKIVFIYVLNWNQRFFIKVRNHPTQVESNRTSVVGLVSIFEDTSLLLVLEFLFCFSY
jgi:hypothetical protein